MRCSVHPSLRSPDVQRTMHHNGASLAAFPPMLRSHKLSDRRFTPGFVCALCPRAAIVASGRMSCNAGDFVWNAKPPACFWSGRQWRDYCERPNTNALLPPLTHREQQRILRARVRHLPNRKSPQLLMHASCRAAQRQESGELLQYIRALRNACVDDGIGAHTASICSVLDAVLSSRIQDAAQAACAVSFPHAAQSSMAPLHTTSPAYSDATCQACMPCGNLHGLHGCRALCW